MKRGRLNIVLGGQAGSEAKGKLSGYLVEKYNPDMIVMTASPNAGHTIVKPDGTKLVSYHLPIAAVMCECPVILTAASLINFETFGVELKALGIRASRIAIDPRASVIHTHHIANEEKGGKSDIGSTLQGIGECRMGKMKRLGRSNHTLVGDIRDAFWDLGVHVINGSAAGVVNKYLDAGLQVLCESTQGFDLDLEHGIDPVYCTSKMINPGMIAAEAGVAPSMVGEVYAVIRPYPIRVNNRTGTSGPYAEAEEIDWHTVAVRCGHPSVNNGGGAEALGEITTTTKLPRRVFEFSWERYMHMIQVCRPTAICLQFANYLDWSCYETKEREALAGKVDVFIGRLEDKGAPVKFVGTGPGHEHMIDLEGR